MRINEKNYVDKAEKVISDLAEESKVKNRGRVNIVTTSKLRNLLAMTADIYNQVLLYPSERLDDELLGRIEYLRVRVMYECGRDNEHKVEKFIKKAEIIECLKEKRTICFLVDIWKLLLHFISTMVEKNSKGGALCTQKLELMGIF